MKNVAQGSKKISILAEIVRYGIFLLVAALGVGVVYFKYLSDPADGARYESAVSTAWYATSSTASKIETGLAKAAATVWGAIPTSSWKFVVRDKTFIFGISLILVLVAVFSFLYRNSRRRGGLHMHRARRTEYALTMLLKEIHNTTIKISDMANTAEQLGKTTFESDKRLASLAATVKEGSTTVQTAATSIDNAHARALEVAERLEKTGDHAQQIAQIADRVHNDTDRIKILSFNAYIRSAGTDANREQQFESTKEEEQQLVHRIDLDTTELLEQTATIHRNLADVIKNMGTVVEEMTRSTVLMMEVRQVLNEKSNESPLIPPPPYKQKFDLSAVLKESNTPSIQTSDMPASLNSRVSSSISNIQIAAQKLARALIPVPPRH